MNTFGRMAEDWIQRFGTEAESPSPPQASAGIPRTPVPPSGERTFDPGGDTVVEPSPIGLHCDPNEWLPEFNSWARERCIFRDRRFRDIGTLWVNFSTWCAESKSVPCDRRVFEWLLADQGFLFADGFVYGLILAKDEDAHGFGAGAAGQSR